MFMSLYNFNAILKIAQERNFKAIGSFNLHCIEMLPAFFKAAQQSHSPLMIQISTGTAEYLGYRLLVDAVRSLAESENVPTCLHLDHCSDISAIETAMDAGFSSVMYDGSHLDLEENIGNTRIVVEMARPRNITVEGELGAIGGSEDGKARCRGRYLLHHGGRRQTLCWGRRGWICWRFPWARCTACIPVRHKSSTSG
nr:ketose-bisphosphate aldolase [Raoultella sp. NCTC 9187]